jgi:hypothetical protein
LGSIAFLKSKCGHVWTLMKPVRTAPEINARRVFLAHFLRFSFPFT